MDFSVILASNTMIYPIAIEHDGTPHSYGVIFPDVAGCISAGNSIKHAIEQAHLALTGHLELMLRDGNTHSNRRVNGDRVRCAPCQ